jgi:hypothetical protein
MRNKPTSFQPPIFRVRGVSASPQQKNNYSTFSRKAICGCDRDAWRSGSWRRSAAELPSRVRRPSNAERTCVLPVPLHSPVVGAGAVVLLHSCAIGDENETAGRPLARLVESRSTHALRRAATNGDWSFVEMIWDDRPTAASPWERRHQQ